MSQTPEGSWIKVDAVGDFDLDGQDSSSSARRKLEAALIQDNVLNEEKPCGLTLATVEKAYRRLGLSEVGGVWSCTSSAEFITWLEQVCRNPKEEVVIRERGDEALQTYLTARNVKVGNAHKVLIGGLKEFTAANLLVLNFSEFLNTRTIAVGLKKRIHETVLCGQQGLSFYCLAARAVMEDPAHALKPLRFESELGRGSFGLTWKVHDRRNSQVSCVKVVALSETARREYKVKYVTRVEDAEAEFARMRRVCHENVVNLFEFGFTATPPEASWAQMELCPGDLAKRFSKSVVAKLSLDEETVFRWMCECTAGLEALHETFGVMHRDIKLDNTLLTSLEDAAAHCKLADLGLSCEIHGENVTFKGGRVGTESYMAPEVLGGEDYSARADVFSLGVMLYNMASGGASHYTWRSHHDDKLFARLSAEDTRCKILTVYALHRDPAKRVSARELRALALRLSSQPAGKFARGSYFVYIAVQPPSIFLIDDRYLFAHRLKEIEQGMIAEQDAWICNGMCPVCLSDADSGTLGADLQAGYAHILVWCATGYGWESRASSKSIEWENLLSALHARPPHLLIVCLKYGARRAAERARAEGVKAVIWISSDICGAEGSDVFFRTISPLLDVARLRMPTTDDVHQIAQGSKVNDAGILTSSDAAHVTWLTSMSTPAAWLQLKASMISRTNLFDDPSCSSLEVLSCDLGQTVRLKEQLQHSADDDSTERLWIFSSHETTPTRSRAIAIEVCRSVAVGDDCDYQLVRRVSSPAELAAVEIVLPQLVWPHRVLLWIDLVGTGLIDPNEEYAVDSLVTSLEGLNAQSHNRLSLLLTCDEDNTEHAEVLMEGLLNGEEDHYDISEEHGVEGVKADSLHQETIKLRVHEDSRPEILEVTSFDAVRKGLVQSLPSSHPVAAIYIDDDGGLLIRMCICDVAFLHQLRDYVLAGDFETSFNSSFKEGNVIVDRSRFAKIYESSILNLNKLTPHQEEKLAAVRIDKNFHIRAAAGAGKTFVALHHIFAALTQPDRRCLFVALNSALCYFVAKWLYRRAWRDDTKHQETLLQRLMVLFKNESGDICGPSSVRVANGRIVFGALDDVPTFDLVVVDEAHHFYSVARYRDEIGMYLRPETQLLVLSDLSQSNGRPASYPPGLQDVRLTEVVRSSERVVAGAKQFQLGGKAKLLTSCHHKSVGPPLRSFIFDVSGDRSEDYAAHTMKALETVIADFPGLSLHDRLAIILPNAQLADDVRPNLEALLKERHTKRFQLVTALEASAAVIAPDDAMEWLVFDSMDHCDGLERLVVIAVGLDAVDDSSDATGVLEARSLLYRAVTRAHMLALVVNEATLGGWLEFLGIVQLDPGKFDVQKETDMTDADATDTFVSEVASAKVELQEATLAAKKLHESSSAIELTRVVVQMKRVHDKAGLMGAPDGTPVEFDLSPLREEMTRVGPMAKAAMQAALDQQICSVAHECESALDVTELKRQALQTRHVLEGAAVFGLCTDHTRTALENRERELETRAAIKDCYNAFKWIDLEPDERALRGVVLNAREAAARATQIPESAQLKVELASLVERLRPVEKTVVAEEVRKLETLLVEPKLEDLAPDQLNALATEYRAALGDPFGISNLAMRETLTQHLYQLEKKNHTRGPKTSQGIWDTEGNSTSQVTIGQPRYMPFQPANAVQPFAAALRSPNLKTVQGPIRLIANGKDPSALSVATTRAYEMEPINYKKASTEERFTNVADTAHAEILFDNPSELGDKITITFDATIFKLSNRAGGSHGGALLHLGYFKLNCNQLVSFIDSQMHSYKIVIHGPEAEVVVDGKIVLSQYVYRIDAKGPASDWYGEELHPELTPSGVLLLGAHHSRRGGAGGAQSVYSRTNGVLKNVKIFRAIDSTQAAVAAPTDVVLVSVRSDDRPRPMEWQIDDSTVHWPLRVSWPAQTLTDQVRISQGAGPIQVEAKSLYFKPHDERRGIGEVLAKTGENLLWSQTGAAGTFLDGKGARSDHHGGGGGGLPSWAAIGTNHRHTLGGCINGHWTLSFTISAAADIQAVADRAVNAYIQSGRTYKKGTTSSGAPSIKNGLVNVKEHGEWIVYQNGRWEQGNLIQLHWFADGPPGDFPPDTTWHHVDGDRAMPPREGKRAFV